MIDQVASLTTIPQNLAASLVNPKIYLVAQTTSKKDEKP